MKSTISILIVFVMTLASCSTYPVTQVVGPDSRTYKIKNAGIVLRISRNSRVSFDEYTKGLNTWLLACKKLIKLVPVVSDEKNAIHFFSNTEDRFFQNEVKEKLILFLHDKYETNFLTWKSRGIINYYLQKNGPALKELMNAEKLDGLIIYDLHGVFSAEMQFVDFSTVMIVVDKDLNLLYMDHQALEQETLEIEAEKMKGKLVSDIFGRLMESLANLDFVEKIEK